MDGDARPQRGVADRDRIRAQAEAFLSLPENRATRDESQLLNSLIERKSFSWTRVLENLEQVMPPRLHLVGIHPELDEDNQLGLKMTVAGDSRDRAIELARRMEESRRFAQTIIVAERSTQSNTGDTVQFDYTAIYIPEPLTAAATPEAKTKAESKASTAPKSNAAPKSNPRPKTKASPLTPKGAKA